MKSVWSTITLFSAPKSLDIFKSHKISKKTLIYSVFILHQNASQFFTNVLCILYESYIKNEQSKANIEL